MQEWRDLSDERGRWRQLRLKGYKAMLFVLFLFFPSVSRTVTLAAALITRTDSLALIDSGILLLPRSERCQLPAGRVSLIVLLVTGSVSQLLSAMLRRRVEHIPWACDCGRPALPCTPKCFVSLHLSDVSRSGFLRCFSSCCGAIACSCERRGWSPLLASSMTALCPVLHGVTLPPCIQATRMTSGGLSW